jgi:DNA-binding CsgD family transcriptional regulator
MANPLLGRDAVLAALDAELAGLAAGRAAAVTVVGEAGIGKTRVLAELACRARKAGALVLSGRAGEFERDLQFAPWVDALDDYVFAVGAETIRSAVAGEIVEELGVVLPAVRRLADDGRSQLGTDERHRTHLAVRALLEWIAAERPMVLLLDDLHWADESSVDLVASLLRRPPRAPVLFALGLRPNQAPEWLRVALDRAEGEGKLRRHALAPLAEEESVRLLGDALPADVRRDLHRESGGNPLFLEHLARHPGAAALGEEAEPAGVPPVVAATLADELRALDEDALALLQGAAVTGDDFDLELAGEAAGLSDEAALRALHILLEHELVRRTSVPRRFALRHPLARRAVYASTGPAWRLGAHARAAAALRARGAAAEVLALHVAVSARPGDESAITLLRDAAAAVLPRTPTVSAQWLRAALALVIERPDTRPLRRTLLVELGTALTVTGELERGCASLKAALELAEADDARERAELVTSLAGAEQLLGRHEQALRRLERALVDVPDGDSPEGVALMLVLAAAGLHAFRFTDMGRWSARALEAAERLQLPGAVFAAEATLTLHCAMTEQIGEGERHSSRAVALLCELSDDALASHLDALNLLALGALYLERFRDVVDHAERGIRIARARRRGAIIPHLALDQALGLLMLGRVDDARSVFARGLAENRTNGTAYSMLGVLYNAAVASLAAGDVEAALREAEESYALAQTVDESPVTAFTGGVLAIVLIDCGEPERGIRLMHDALGGRSLPKGFGFCRSYWFEALIRAALAVGRLDDAREYLAYSEDNARALGLPLAGAWAARSRARLALSERDFRAAADLARASAAGAERVGARVEAARARIVAGRALAAAGDRDGAVIELEHASAELESGGALGYLDAARRELRRLGRRRRGRTDETGLIALSARELEVAALVAAEATNKQIAGELLLSEKTVESHLRNVFAKLRVSSRSEVAQLVHAAREAGRWEGLVSGVRAA